MSEQTERNIEVIKKGYEAFAAGDVETVLSLFDDDIEWVQPGESAISGTYHGKGELGQFFARLAEKGATSTPRRFVADDDIVVALTDDSVGGERAQNAVVCTVRDGKAVRAEVHTDTAMLERQFGKKQVATG